MRQQVRGNKFEDIRVVFAVVPKTVGCCEMAVACKPLRMGSNRDLGEDRVQALASGFEMHIAKPVEPEELVAVLRDLARLP
jgi:DNA-binding response OmpR family regulator